MMFGLGAIALAMVALAAGFAMHVSAATEPGLGTASSYAVLAGSTATNTGASTIEGNLGVSPGSAVTGFPPGVVTNGAIHAADANALQAQNDVTNTYNTLAGDPCDVTLTGQDLGGMTLTPSVYCFSTSAQLTGQLRLDAQGSAAAVFIFQIGSTLTTASNASVLVINGGSDCNAYWQVGSSATLGAGTTFVGNIVALTSISLDTASSISGRALARNGAVTLDTNHIGFAACAPTDTRSPTASPVPTAGPTGTAVPTALPTAVPTAAPTDTPIGQTPAPTPVGETPSPIPTPTPVGQTPSPIPTPTPVGQTPSRTPTPTLTLTSTPTPVGQTPSPTPTATSVAPTPTAVRSATVTPSATPATPTPVGGSPPQQAPANTPSPTPNITHFPNTGGPPGTAGVPWLALLLGLASISLGGVAVVVSFRMNRPSPQRIEIDS